jgi:hypothetical protein
MGNQLCNNSFNGVPEPLLTVELLPSTSWFTNLRSLLPEGEWYANAVSLLAPGRWLVLFTNADTLVSVVRRDRPGATTLPIFERRFPLLLRRLGLPKPWVQARADAFGEVHVGRRGAQTASRRVLGTMTNLAYQIRAEAEAAGSFERLDLDRVEDCLTEVPLSVLGYGHPARAVAELAGA